MLICSEFMNNAWFPLYSGDYGRKTAHLSVVENGAYLLLLIHYYATGRPLPNDKVSLYRIARAHGDDERAAVDSVVSQFFTLQDDGYHNSRADVELGKRAEFHNKLAAAGRKRWQQPGIEPGTSQAVSVAGSPAIARPQPQPQLQKEKTSSAPKTGAREIGSTEFQAFWDAYPRHEGRKPALKAWMRLNLDSRLGEVLAGLEAWKANRDPTYMPYAQGWLNQESWKDTPLGGKQEQANGRNTVPQNFDEARNQKTDAALRRVAEHYSQRLGTARPALPAPTG